jgi:tRNA A-37 threonylcarbamoyl transferase component Bud32/tetratricopeptide (TPR) repeat protein
MTEPRPEFASIEKAFRHAVGLERSAREGFLAEVAGHDPKLAARLSALLAADAAQDSDSGIPGEDALLVVRSTAGVGGDAGILTGRRIGGFEIGDLIGQGGSGAVYRARQARPARVVAFKAMRPEVAGAKARRRFELEAEHMALLAHPNIASVIAAGFDDESRVSWMATEFVEGARSIVRYAEEMGLGISDRLLLMRSVCEAVSAAHAKGVLHRDLKPSNMLVGADGVVKVIDFGLSRAISVADGRSLATETGEIVGTLLYMSPEQSAGDAKAVDVRSDVFALGAVLYELIAGCAPREIEGNFLEAIRSIAVTDIPAPSLANPAIGADLDAVVGMASAREPDARYPTVRALSEDLTRVLAGEPVRARVPSALRKFRFWVRREPRLASAVGVAAAATLGLLLASGFYANGKRAEARRASEMSQRVYEQLVPAAARLALTQDAPAVREIDLAAYELSVLLNGADHPVSARLALKLAFDWLKGVGYDTDRAEEWAVVAERSASRSPELGVDSALAIEARCVQAWALVARAAGAREGEVALAAVAKERLEALLPVIEQRDDVDPASDCLGTLGEYAEAEGDLAGATEYYIRAIARSARIRGSADEVVVQTRSYLVDTLRRQGRWEETLAELEALLSIQREHERGFSPWTIRFAMQRGEALLRLGRLEFAVDQLIEADELVRSHIGPNHGMRNRIRAYLREALAAQGVGDDEIRQWSDVPLEA